jgi:hypothetical protein
MHHFLYRTTRRVLPLWAPKMSPERATNLLYDSLGLFRLGTIKPEEYASPEVMLNATLISHLREIGMAP